MKGYEIIEIMGVMIVCLLLGIIATEKLEPFTEFYFDNKTLEVIKEIPYDGFVFDKISFVVANFENKEMEYVCELDVNIFKDEKLKKIDTTKTRFSLNDKEKKIFTRELDLPKDYDHIRVVVKLMFENESQEIYFWIHDEKYHHTFREKSYLAEWNFFEYEPDFYLNIFLFSEKIKLNKRMPIQFVIKDDGDGGKYEYEVRKTIYFMNNKVSDRLNYSTLTLEKDEKKLVKEKFSLEQGNYPIEIKISVIHEDTLKELNFSLNITSKIEEKLRVIDYGLLKNKVKSAEGFDVEIETEILKQGNYEFIDESGQEVRFKQEGYSQENKNNRIKEIYSLRSFVNTKPGKYDVFLTFFNGENQLENLLENKELYLGEIVIENDK